MNDLDIKSFAHLEGPAGDYLGLPKRIEGLTDSQARAERAGTEALLAPANTYYQNSQSMSFLACRAGTPVGRLTAFYNPQLRDERYGIGLVGHFACEDDSQTARQLISSAAEWLAAQGCQIVRGPMNGDIWHRWRFMTRGFDTVPFPGEPRQPAYYPGLFAASGFAPVRTHSTKLITDVHAQYERLLKPAHFNSKRGITYRALDHSRWAEELHSMYELCLHSFATNWSVTDTTAEEFYAIYDRWLKRAGPEHILFAVDPAGSIMGLGLALAAGSDTVCLKTIAVLPSQYGYGLGQAIGAEIYQRAIKRGFTKALHCLMDPMSPAQRWDGGLGIVEREYTMYERSVQ